MSERSWPSPFDDNWQLVAGTQLECRYILSNCSYFGQRSLFAILSFLLLNLRPDLAGKLLKGLCATFKYYLSA